MKNLKTEKEIKVWGQAISIDELYRILGFIVQNDGQLNSLYHRREDNVYFDWAKENVQKLADSINLNKRVNYGMSGENDFQDDAVKGKLICPIPLKFLDPGIALLCKVLPLHGISTVYSCSGHLESQDLPSISFRSQEDYLSARELFNEVLQLDFQKVKFTTEKGWMGTRVDFLIENYDEKSYFETFWFIHNFSTVLLKIEKNTISGQMRLDSRND